MLFRSPLVAGMNMREFAGVLAHEFGHFTQGTGMRLSYVIRTINGWFGRVVYERDTWDVTLEVWAMEAESFYISIALGFARLSVWLTRRILQLLMLLGHGISCFLTRQMEYDADIYQMRVAGSEGFESAHRSLPVFGAVIGHTYKQLAAP